MDGGYKCSLIMSEDKSYKHIFKTTFLFGFVQVAKLLVAVIKNKIVAILLGPSGLGVISVYNNAINLIKSGASLGIYQSAVKDVAEANSQNDKKRFSFVISVTNRIVLFTTILGLIITIFFSPLLSKWGFGDNKHTIPFICLSIAVAFDIYAENAMAVLKGMRHLQSLAKATLIGSIIALLTGVPLFFLYGENGIVPSIIISAISTAWISYMFISKINYDRIKISWKETFQTGSSMIKMGGALMLSNFLSYIFSMVIVSYIQYVGGLSNVGFYSAGSVLVISYFSMITTAMNTDYYPRIAAISKENIKIQEEVTRQSTAGLILMFPLVIIFVLFVHYVIDILYTNEFLKVVQFTDIAVIGTMLTVISNCLGYVLIVKQESKLYLWTSMVLNIIYIPIYLLLYKYFGLYGLGISYTTSIVLQLIAYWSLCYVKYQITISKGVIIESLLIMISVFVSIMVRSIETTWIKYTMETLILLLVFLYTIIRLKRTMGIDVTEVLKNKIWRE